MHDGPIAQRSPVRDSRGIKKTCSAFPAPPEALTGRRTQPPRRRGRGPALLASALLLLASCSGGGASRPGTPPRNVVLIALDGADWKLIRPLIAQGRMPTLARLIDGGSSGELQTLLPTLSPLVWTTIATGQLPERHGIDGFWHEAPAGEQGLSAEEEEHQERLRALGYIGGPSKTQSSQMVLYRSTDRKVPAIWNLFSASKLTTDVLAWWITYPAEAIDGVMVSDRFLYNRFVLVAEKRGMPYETQGRLVSPQAEEARLKPLIMKVEDVTAQDLAPFVHGDITLHPNLTLHEVEDELRMVYAKDTSVVRMAKALLAGGSPRFFTVYIQGVDISSHYFWKYRFPEDWKRKYPEDPVPPAEIARYGGAIDAYYELQDRNIGEILRAAGEGVTVVVCSDHGFVTGKRPPGTPGAAATVSGVHEEFAPPGIVVLAGPRIQKGRRLAGARVLDIAPTLLTLLGQPADPSMPGHALSEAFETGAGR